MKVVILTGAGISAESGLRTFRGSDGLWEGHRIEDVCTPEAFRRNPDLVYHFYNERRRQLQDDAVQPNAAHLAVARYEHCRPEGFLLVTQNVDDLHERAGSRQVLHMHGRLLAARCLDTGKVYPWRGDLTSRSPHPDFPDRVGRLRPHIVWFGEVPLHMAAIQAAVQRCDVFVAIGTSGSVYPAAGLVAETPAGCRRVEINTNRTDVSDAFDEHWIGPAGEQVPAFFETLPH